ncbi:MAG: ATP synthase subunit I [Lachnospiraceae bacterium]|nr:ATP synthase subunit I [Lachnospiraceae bacterium]MDE6748745.1 ATP synthase subunit I [Lachnospiraceae bacterium]
MEKSWKKKIDTTLFELCLGIFLFGIVCQAVILIFSRNPDYSIGLWIGTVLGITSAIHMWWSLNRGLDMAEKDAVKALGTQSLVRNFVFIAVVVLLAISGFADPICAFLGYMGMKVSAYMQPFIHRISSKVFGMQ